MSCWRGGAEEKTPPILDVEKVLKDYVWNRFVSGLTGLSGRLQRLCLRRSDFIVDVPMNYFHFETIPNSQRVITRTKPQLGENGHILGMSKSAEHNMSETKFGTVRKNETKGGAKFDVVEIATNFENNTDLEQTYRFRLEKTRKAILNVNIQRGFTIGGRARVTVGLPKLASDTGAEGEIDMRLNISKTEGETVEETLTLETISDIKIAKRSKYVAKVVLAEAPVSYDFKIWSRMTMPTGGANVSIIRKKDNKTYHSSVIPSLHSVFEYYANKKDIVLHEMDSERETAQFAVDIKTTGIIEGVRLSNQRIVLESHAISPTPKEDHVYSGGTSPPLVPTIENDYTSQRDRGSTAQRPRSVGGPIIEEITEIEEEEEEDSASIGNGVVPFTGRRAPAGPGAIPSIVTTSPSSAASSPLSEKAGSEGSDISKTITTV